MDYLEEKKQNNFLGHRTSDLIKDIWFQILGLFIQGHHLTTNEDFGDLISILTEL